LKILWYFWYIFPTFGMLCKAKFSNPGLQHEGHFEKGNFNVKTERYILLVHWCRFCVGQLESMYIHDRTVYERSLTYVCDKMLELH
jgi:hypothetical protein